MAGHALRALRQPVLDAVGIGKDLPHALEGALSQVPGHLGEDQKGGWFQQNTSARLNVRPHNVLIQFIQS